MWLDLGGRPFPGDLPQLCDSAPHLLLPWVPASLRAVLPPSRSSLEVGKFLTFLLVQHTAVLTQSMGELCKAPRCGLRLARQPFSPPVTSSSGAGSRQLPPAAWRHPSPAALNTSSLLTWASLAKRHRVSSPLTHAQCWTCQGAGGAAQIPPLLTLMWVILGENVLPSSSEGTERDIDICPPCRFFNHTPVNRLVLLLYNTVFSPQFLFQRVSSSSCASGDQVCLPASCSFSSPHGNYVSASR